MTVDEIKMQVMLNSDYKDSPYAFIHRNEHLGDNLILLGFGGSYAYGTNIETSDIDLRGCTLNTKKEILTNQKFEQFEDSNTDTVIYSFNKLISLLSNVNPNTIEMLGLRPDHYLYITKVGRELIDNRHLFLSKKCVQSFGGYATAQIRKLKNISNGCDSHESKEQFILDSINKSYDLIKEKYKEFSNDSIRLYIDSSISSDVEAELFADIHLVHYPLRDYVRLNSELSSLVKSYEKVGKRNSYAIIHNKLGKHMMHCIRLLLMCIDILLKKEIITYREDDHDLLMSIRNGDFIDKTNNPKKEFYDLVHFYEEKLHEAFIVSSLPEKPDYEKIYKFMSCVNERIVKGV